MSAPLSVAFDATRLKARLKLGMPTGIDRVDLAYLHALASDPGIHLSLVAHGPLGVRRLTASVSRQLLACLARDWHPPQAQEPPQGAALRQWLESPAGTPRPALPAPRHAAAAVATTPLALPARGPAPGVFLHSSHGQLHRRAYARWLARTGLKGVFFVHDLIPIEYPEYSRAAEPARHAARLATIAGHARAVLVNSAATRDSLRRYWAARNVRTPAITVAPLGLSLDTTVQALPSPQAAVPYFVLLGTIEPRKNHGLLLKLWRQMAESDPLGTPRLVLVGRRGWENETVFNLLDRAPALGGHVIECAGLPDAGLLALLRGATALLNPSFAEGYGLPVAEALAAGVPVLASDLAAHREVAGACADYLDPLDGAGWLAAIRELAAPGSPRRATALQRVAGYRPPTWAAHFEIVRDALNSTT